MNESIRTLFSPHKHLARWCALVPLVCALTTLPGAIHATAPEISPPATHVADPIDELTEIMVEAREPRYVVAHAPRPNRPHLGAGHDQRTWPVSLGARHRRESQRHHRAGRLGARHSHRSIAAGDFARRDRLRHRADHPGRHLERRRSGSRSADAAHRAGCVGRRRRDSGIRGPDGQAHFHRFSP